MSSLTRFFVKELHTPIGCLTVVTTEKGVSQIHFGQLKKVNATAKLAKNKIMPEWVDLEEEPLDVGNQVLEYLNGTRHTFDVEIDLIGTPFQKKVWEALQKIDYGKTKTYKEIAEAIGAPKAVRAVGGANNQNPLPIIIPCHRVIGSNGAMVGYGGGLTNKELLLTLESKVSIS